MNGSDNHPTGSAERLRALMAVASAQRATPEDRAESLHKLIEESAAARGNLRLARRVLAPHRVEWPRPLQTARVLLDAMHDHPTPRIWRDALHVLPALVEEGTGTDHDRRNLLKSRAALNEHRQLVRREAFRPRLMEVDRWIAQYAGTTLPGTADTVTTHTPTWPGRTSPGDPYDRAPIGYTVLLAVVAIGLGTALALPLRDVLLEADYYPTGFNVFIPRGIVRTLLPAAAGIAILAAAHTLWHAMICPKGRYHTERHLGWTSTNVAMGAVMVALASITVGYLAEPGRPFADAPRVVEALFPTGSRDAAGFVWWTAILATTGVGFSIALDEAAPEDFFDTADDLRLTPSLLLGVVPYTFAFFSLIPLRPGFWAFVGTVLLLLVSGSVYVAGLRSLQRLARRAVHAGAPVRHVAVGCAFTCIALTTVVVIAIAILVLAARRFVR